MESYSSGDGKMEKWRDKGINGRWMSGQTDRQAGRQTDRYINRRMDREIDRLIDRKSNG